MDRRSFLAQWAMGSLYFRFPQDQGSPYSADSRSSPGGSSSNVRTAMQEGVRRLSKDKYFTVYHSGLTPSYRVQLGEFVLIECQHGLPGLVTRDGRFQVPKEGDTINPATGPIFIEGIESGDGLAIELMDIRVGEWGYSDGRVFELVDGFAVIDKSLKLALQPMIGGIGVAPAKGEMDTRTPTDTGGNLDCKEVRAGSTVVFTAQVKGALLGLGDPHALQGDGEISGQGIETDAEVLVRFRKLPEKLSERPVILRQEFVATLSSQKDLGEAAWQATDDMVGLVSKFTNRSEKDARMLVNLVGNLRINQIVDPAKGARMEVPTWLFGMGRGMYLN
ncbi:MAG TPA: acetamidase/formamidase family protein [Terriglobia bacterium]|nr:acetamidase/formamidase family protein [Terriglobia bacterium]